jgi:hypothetical protein
VDHYNGVRLHSAIGYVTPLDKLQGREAEIFAQRDRQAARGSTAATVSPLGGFTRLFTEATGNNWPLVGHRSKLNRPGETEAGSAGTQPRRGITRWAHRDDEVGVCGLRSTPLPNLFVRPHRSDRPGCLENPRPKGGKSSLSKTAALHFRLNQDNTSNRVVCSRSEMHVGVTKT